MSVKSKYIILSSALFATAAAADVENWRSMPDGFNIFYNSATDGCFAELQTDQGYVVHIGTEAELYSGAKSASAGFLAVYAPGDLGDGHTGDMSLVDVAINGRDYPMIAVDVKRDGYTGGFIVGRAEDLRPELEKMREMQILTPDATVTINASSLDIPAALDQVQTCQEQRKG